MIVEIRNKTEAPLLLKIGVNERCLQRFGLADGEAVPVELQNSRGFTIELAKLTKDRHCG